MEETVKKKKKAAKSRIANSRIANSRIANSRVATRKLKYEKSETPVDTKGLTFPDNFMAIMGWRRVK